ncbi:MAG: DUF3179 domain-containing protein [Acidimicrobiia bacterium]|nr:DUF3179 domain-containing protein [Acidimicrobiia bacterium]
MKLRVVALAVVLSLVASACGGSSGDDGPASSSSTTAGDGDAVTTTQGSNPSGVSALEVAYSDGLSNDDPRFPTPGIDVDRLLFGLPGPDLIPAIDDPVLTPASELGAWLEPAEAVVFVERNGDARAYPVRVLMNHEIVNDVVGDDPITVTYCPLCNSALAFVREVNGVETTFGVSGMLFNSSLVMYDRLTQSLWLHFTGEAVVGDRTGDQLERVSAGLVSWEGFVEAHPDGLVLDPPNRDRYGRNPYAGSGFGGSAYDTLASEPFLFNGTTDPRSESMRRVVGVVRDGDARAWTITTLQGGLGTVTAGEVGDDPVVVLWSPGQASALAGETVATGRDVGTAGVFSPVVDGAPATFSVDTEGGFVDDITGTTWNVLGEAVAGPLEGSTLERIPHLDTFWFAWSSFQPETLLTTPSGTIPAETTSE